MSITVSVIIPTYNRAHFLSETVHSVLGQSLEGVEVIIVDDGSIDSTRDVLADFDSVPNVRIFFRENRGRSVARNFGIEQARGEYIMFLDSDDLLHSESLAALYAAAKANPDSRVIGGDWTYMYENGEDYPPCLDVNYHRERRSETIGVDMIQDFYLCIGSYIIKSDLLRILGGFDPTTELSEDFDLYIRFCEAAPVTFIRRDIVKIRRHDGNTSEGIQYRSFAEVGKRNLIKLRGRTDKESRELRAAWHLRIGDDYYNLGWGGLALRNYTMALMLGVFFLRKDKLQRIVRQITASLVPAGLRRRVKSVWPFHEIDGANAVGRR
jgi:glycosyltransferase involved in cell wall biosynthesis